MYFEMPGKCTFQDRWLADERYEDRILKDAADKYFAKCAVCVKRLSLASFWKHADTDGHKKKLKRHRSDSRFSMGGQQIPANPEIAIEGWVGCPAFLYFLYFNCNFFYPVFLIIMEFGRVLATLFLR